MRNYQKDKGEISIVAENWDMSERTISKVYDHMFRNKYELSNGYSTFAVEYKYACI